MLGNVTVEYEEFNIKLKVPSTVVTLLETITEIFPVELEDVLSKMASQGLSNVLQEIIPKDEKNPKEQIDNIEPMNKISDQLSDLQNVIGRFSDMQKIFGDLTDGANINNSKQNKENSE